MLIAAKCYTENKGKYVKSDGSGCGSIYREILGILE